MLFVWTILVIPAHGQAKRAQVPNELMGHRFLILNTVIRVNQIEAARDCNEGFDERYLHKLGPVKLQYGNL